MIVTLGTTGPTADPPPVELAAGEGLIVNGGAFRVVIHGDGSMHVIDDREGDTVFEWPVPTRYVVVGHLTPTDGDPDPAVQYLDGIVREIDAR